MEKFCNPEFLWSVFVSLTGITVSKTHSVPDMMILINKPLDPGLFTMYFTDWYKLHERINMSRLEFLWIVVAPLATVTYMVSNTLPEIVVPCQPYYH
jgi:hypothetical protein